LDWQAVVRVCGRKWQFAFIHDSDHSSGEKIADLTVKIHERQKRHKAPTGFLTLFS
jgi:hypothetical protein